MQSPEFPLAHNQTRSFECLTSLQGFLLLHFITVALVKRLLDQINPKALAGYAVLLLLVAHLLLST
jgi:hypothetical protein